MYLSVVNHLKIGTTNGFIFSEKGGEGEEGGTSSDMGFGGVNGDSKTCFGLKYDSSKRWGL